MNLPHIQGYAVVFNTLSSEGKGTDGQGRLYFPPGAFRVVLSYSKPIEARINHVRNRVVATTEDGGLHLHEDARGLWYEIRPHDTPQYRNLVAEIKAGSATGVSLGSRHLRTPWTQHFGARASKGVVTSLWEISILLSPYEPAMPDTTVQLQYKPVPEPVERQLTAAEVKAIDEECQAEIKRRVALMFG